MSADQRGYNSQETTIDDAPTFATMAHVTVRPGSQPPLPGRARAGVEASEESTALQYSSLS